MEDIPLTPTLSSAELISELVETFDTFTRQARARDDISDDGHLLARDARDAGRSC